VASALPVRQYCRSEFLGQIGGFAGATVLDPYLSSFELPVRHRPPCVREKETKELEFALPSKLPLTPLKRHFMDYRKPRNSMDGKDF
jgi:hypothetical protein